MGSGVLDSAELEVVGGVRVGDHSVHYLAPYEHGHSPGLVPLLLVGVEHLVEFQIDRVNL